MNLPRHARGTLSGGRCTSANILGRLPSQRAIFARACDMLGFVLNEQEADESDTVRSYHNMTKLWPSMLVATIEMQDIESAGTSLGQRAKAEHSPVQNKSCPELPGEVDGRRTLVCLTAA